MEKNTIENPNEHQNGVKRAWVTPQIEIISGDDIQGGFFLNTPESTTGTQS